MDQRENQEQQERKDGGPLSWLINLFNGNPAGRFSSPGKAAGFIKNGAKTIATIISSNQITIIVLATLAIIVVFTLFLVFSGMAPSGMDQSASSN